ncbi:MAG: tetraacyldisaccharide 4'-kinase, partial [Gammaproteobacteria bacterium]
MVHRAFHDWLLRRWYGSRPIWFFIPLAGFFAAFTALRRWAYRLGVFKTVTLPVPVIVVGNITVGGTGKTPFVIWLAQTLQAQGYRPGIITRGYGGKSKHWPLPVTATTDPVMAGDEAVLLAQHAKLPVMAGPDRVRAAQRLQEESQVNTIISDDGLQHYRLGRAIEINMLDGSRGFGNGSLLPAGPLREPRRRLKKVSLVVCKSNQAATPGSGMLVMGMVLDNAISLADGLSRPLSEFAGQRVYAVAGISHPEQFFVALEERGLRVDRRPLPDHVKLRKQDLLFEDSAPVLMTEKDA